MKTFKDQISEENKSNAGEKVEKSISLMEEAQEFLREAAAKISEARRELDSIDEGIGEPVSERIYRYLLGNLEPLIDNEHVWLTRSTSIQDIIEEIMDMKKGFE